MTHPPPQHRVMHYHDGGGGGGGGGGGRHHHILYPASRRPPYLRPTSPVVETTADPTDAPRHSYQQYSSHSSSSYNARGGEADVAGGGGGGALTRRRRVQSFTLLPHSPSAETLPISNVNMSPARTTTPRVMTPSLRANKKDNDRQKDGGDLTDWRSKDRTKTVGVGLVLALNIGTDPPDVIKPVPCGTMQCWMDPQGISRGKAKELISARLEMQYSKWSLTAPPRNNTTNNNNKLTYKRVCDPTIQEVRTLCVGLRKQAKRHDERLLLHYNGHGVPRPTSQGEIWLFDQNQTAYVPLAVADLRQWLGKPSIVVLDCGAAATLLPHWTSTSTSTATATATPMHQAGGSSGTTSVTDEETATTTASQAAAAADNESDHSYVDDAWVKDTIVLCPTAAHEALPLPPCYPADIFTSCLTTPIPMALRYFVTHNRLGLFGNVPLEQVDILPGKVGDRKSPLGELNWIFTAITDSIAWNVLPRPLFRRLFRHDLLVASLFRNFLLADRILRSLGCTPTSHPALPLGISQHPLWRTWDLAVETMLMQLQQLGWFASPAPAGPPTTRKGAGIGGSLDDDADDDHSFDDNSHTTESDPSYRRSNTSGSGSDPPTSSPSTVSATPSNKAAAKVMPAASTVAAVLQSWTDDNVSSPFFSEQLLGFEVWLDYARIHATQMRDGLLAPPEQLPVLLQVLLSQTHRIRALRLLRRFLDMGAWAVNLALSVGVFPYISKLLQSAEYKSLLVSIWVSVLSHVPSCRVDLLKDGAFRHFVQHLMWGLNHSHAVTAVQEAAQERTLAAFVLSVACADYTAGQTELARLNLHGNCCALLSSYEQGENVKDETVDVHLPGHFRMWVCLCLGNMVKNNMNVQNEAFIAGVQARLAVRLQDVCPEVRAAVCYALGCLISWSPKLGSRPPSSSDLLSVMPTQQAFLSAPPPGMLPQRFTTNATFAVPGDSTQAMPGQLPPNSTQGGHAAGASQWRPQDMMPQQLQPATIQSQSFGAGTGQQGPLGMPSTNNVGGFGDVAASTSGLNGPGRRPHGPQPLPGQQQLFTSPPSFPSPSRDARSGRASVYEDRRRLDLDFECLDALMDAAMDASAVVRYEATIGLAVAVGKYLEAFIIVAEEVASVTASPEFVGGRKLAFAVPRGLDRHYLDRFRVVWKLLRQLQHDDPYPVVAKAANDIVSVVHEQLLRTRTEAGDSDESKNEDDLPLHTKKLAYILAGIDEDTDVSTPGNAEQRSNFMRQQLGDKVDMRRVASESVSGKSRVGSMEESAKLSAAATNVSAGSLRLELGPITYSLPQSEFFAWKRDSFVPHLTDLEGYVNNEADALSPDGARRLYLDNRNAQAKDEGRKMAQKYACLAPKPPKPAKKGIEMLLEVEEDAVLIGADEEAASQKKRALEMSERRLLLNESVSMTSMLTFHSYEDVLVSCGAPDLVCLWDTNSGRRICRIANGNPKNTRMTSSMWINEDNASLFLIGCDDGSVRIWANMLERNLAASPPYVVSAFTASPMQPGPRGGLVCEWQPHTQSLLAGGNGRHIRCWDLESEKEVYKMETGIEANVTTMATAWDYDSLGTGGAPSGHPGIGRDVFVAGYADGTLKLFDTRMHRPDAGTLQDTVHRKGNRATLYREHKSWVVSTAFTSYEGRYELISGTTGGNIKAWDLRMSTSLRTLDVLRSTMTAMAVHTKIPIVATGSESQFIKTLTLDGDTVQIIRSHEKMQSLRIGPVSCIALHRFKPIMAAGAIDTYIGLYSAHGLSGGSSHNR